MTVSLFAISLVWYCPCRVALLYASLFFTPTLDHPGDTHPERGSAAEAEGPEKYAYSSISLPHTHTCQDRFQVDE